MKILGKTNLRKRFIKVPIGHDPVTGEPEELTLHPPKYGDLAELERRVVKPRPPMVDPRGGGKGVKRAGVKKVPNEEDPRYMEQLTEWRLALSIGRLFLAAGDQFTDIPAQEKDETGIAYYLRMSDVLADAGLDYAVQLTLCRQVDRLTKPLGTPEVILMRRALGTDEGETEAEAEEKAAEVLKAVEAAGGNA